MCATRPDGVREACFSGAILFRLCEGLLSPSTNAEFATRHPDPQCSREAEIRASAEPCAPESASTFRVRRYPPAIGSNRPWGFQLPTRGLRDKNPPGDLPMMDSAQSLTSRRQHRGFSTCSRGKRGASPATAGLAANDAIGFVGAVGGWRSWETIPGRVGGSAT